MDFQSDFEREVAQICSQNDLNLLLLPQPPLCCDKQTRGPLIGLESFSFVLVSMNIKITKNDQIQKF